jgi:hypothetical protein
MPAVRECLTQFGRRAAIKRVGLLEEHVFDAMKMDIYMAQHLSTLQQMIREKASCITGRPISEVELGRTGLARIGRERKLLLICSSV